MVEVQHLCNADRLDHRRSNHDRAPSLLCAPMTTSPLSSRLRDGQGADRELDAAIHDWVMSRWKGGNMNPPHYCTDLNAVFALVERELPGWKIALYDTHDTNERFAYIWPGSSVDIPPWEPDWDLGHDGYCDHPRASHGKHSTDRCRAGLLAVLSAIEISKGDIR